MTAVAPVDSGRVFAVRDEVLRAPEFNVSRDWRTRLIDWFVENVEKFAASLPLAARIFGMIVIATVLLMILWWLVPALGARVRRPSRKTASAQLGIPGLGFAAAEQQAKTALAAGRFQECVRAVWLSALALLEQGGLSPARRARTDWEHVRAASRLRPDVEPLLNALVISFQRTHFGRVAVDQDEARTCLQRLSDLQRLLEQPLPVAEAPPSPEARPRG